MSESLRELRNDGNTATLYRQGLRELWHVLSSLPKLP